ncbi:hypothetical protein H2201_005607 [Coniosporium apollinis]|uniref:Uncharacterized protein n=2 Tax=Coniosporium TaxID=2810619 RepID=A0ABQ9NPY7_9PEZI|nr:hypothetical protein H2199_003267 [Cladosporium sp. JES 115]KAJ9663399.1 hypothetical protein H2201_005607 [Coniosporium apollinis]
MADQRHEKPRILLLSLANKEWFDEMYSRLINTLAEGATLQRASKPDAALRYLANNTPQAILVTDAGLAERNHSAVLARVVEYARSGGIVVVGCMFSSFMSRPKMEAFFRDGWNLPWRYGDYHRTDVHLNRRVRQINKMFLAPTYSQKAVFLDNVAADAALYLPNTESWTQSHVFINEPVRDIQQSPVVYAAVGEGWLGYVGDVNAEEASDNVVLAMCGLDSAN